MSASVAEPLVTAGTVEPDGTAWIVGGVAAELGDRLEASVGFIRVLLVFALLIGGADVLYGYTLAALVIPRSGRRAPSWSNVIAAARIGLSIALVVALATAGGGIDVFDRGPAVWLPIAGATLFGVVLVVASGAACARRDPRRDRAVALAILAALAGLGLVALAIELVPSLRWDWATGALAALAGVGLVTGGPRAKALLVPAGLLAVLAVLLASAGVRLQGGIGDERFAPGNAGALQHSYRRAIGDVTLDLAALRPSATTHTVDVSVGLGNVSIVIPYDAQVTAVVHVGRGTLDAYTCSASRGFPVNLTFALDQTRRIWSPAEGQECGLPLHHPALVLRIDASVGIGSLHLSTPNNQFGGS
ncbi:MAG: LiaF domain-containing protein [Solirubrobacteraceae bacterium]|jgi:phage shock protein PspC (stress-responsive transcriptional regulator)